MSDNIVHTSDDGFQEDVLNSDKPVLVDYWAEWCGPCKMIAPSRVKLPVNTPMELRYVSWILTPTKQHHLKYGIRGIPTLMLFKNGEVEATKVGALSKSQLQAF